MSFKTGPLKSVVDPLSSCLPAPASCPSSPPPPSSTGKNAAGGVTTSCAGGGRLSMIILSAYDLPDREPPLYVRLDIGAQSVHTGPPVQRHKDRNSFKFHSHRKATTATAATGELTIQTPTLSDLYQETATLTIVYTNPTKPQYTASYPLHQLLIHETTWLILNLTPSTTNTNTTNAAAASGTTDPIPEPTTTTAAAAAATTTTTTTTAAVSKPKLLSNGSTSMEDMEDDEVPPTLRLQMTLDGPYRTEIAALVQLTQAWLALVDDIEQKIQTHLVPLLPRIRIPLAWFLVPTAPILCFCVVTIPIWMGVALMTLPLVLPILVLTFCLGTIAALLAAIVYASTKQGRHHVANLLHPIQHALMHTQTGQAWIYQTGPRPTPVHLCRTLFPSGIWGKLILSLWIDFLGSATYLLPVLGEVVDVLWAPLQTTFIMALYCPSSTGKASPGSAVLPYLSFLEEILPLTDIVPTATLGWLGEFAVPLVQQQLFPTSGTTRHASHPGSSDSLRVVLSTNKQPSHS